MTLTGTHVAGDAGHVTDHNLIDNDIVALQALAGAGTVPFSQPGSAAIGVSGAWTAPAAGALDSVDLTCVGAPAGSALSVDFRKNGTSFQTLTIADGTTTPTTASPVVTFADGDLITVSATSVGSGTAATGVVAQFNYTLT